MKAVFVERMSSRNISNVVVKGFYYLGQITVTIQMMKFTYKHFIYYRGLPIWRIGKSGHCQH